MAKTRFGLIGAGSIAQSYLKAFNQSDTAQLVAVADVDIAAAARAAAASGGRVFDSHLSLLRGCEIDAALICTPPVTHAPIVVDLVRAGVHVLCEKPFSIDVAGAGRMLRAAERAGVQLTMASKFRYVADVIAARSIIETGELGDVLTFENAFTSTVSMAGRWHADPTVSGGGVIIDNGTHSVDILRYLCGPVTAVAAYEGARTQALAVEDTAHVVARTTRNVLASIDLSWSCTQENEHYLQICGTRGAMCLGWQRARYRRGDRGEWVDFGRGYDKLAALSGQLDNFCRSLKGQEPLLISAADALASVEVIASLSPRPAPHDERSAHSSYRHS